MRVPHVNHKHDGLPMSEYDVTSVYCRTNAANKRIYYWQLYLCDMLSRLIHYLSFSKFSNETFLHCSLLTFTHVMRLF